MIKYTKADLHFHTHNSDGGLSIEQLQKIVEKIGGNKVVSITDHNYLTLDNYFEKNGILWIPGIEISAYANNHPVHITGYSLKPKISKNLRTILNNIIYGYNNRAQKNHEELIKAGYKLPPLETFRDKDLPQTVHKIDIAVQLGKLVGIENPDDAIQYAKKNGNLLFVKEKNFMPDVDKVIPALIESNFVTSWAHPGKKLFQESKDDKDSIKTLDHITTSGIQGIEVYAHKHSKDQTKYLLNLAKQRNLLITGGGDFHRLDHGKLLFPLGEELTNAFLKRIGY